jgi:DNA repair exonuclease SbcCD ATPase subunit
VRGLAGAELAAAQEPGAPRGPVDASWLILQRLDDLRRAQDDLRRAQDELRADMKALDAKIESVRDELRADARALDAKIDTVRAELEAKIDTVRVDLEAKIESVRRESLGLWRWSLALLLVPILGLLAKLLVPSV